LRLSLFSLSRRGFDLFTIFIACIGGEKREQSGMWSGRYATHDLLIIVSGVFAEPNFTMLTLANLSANPVLVHHPHVTLTNGVDLVGHSNGTGVTGRIFYASHCWLSGWDGIRQGRRLGYVQVGLVG